MVYAKITEMYLHVRSSVLQWQEHAGYVLYRTLVKELAAIIM